MADFAVLAGAGQVPVGRNLSGDSALVSVTAAGTAHTKGSYAELSAATTRRMDGFWLHIHPDASAVAWAMLDIAIGAAGSEIVVVPNLMFFSNTVELEDIWIPLELALGVRVAARVQSSVTSKVYRVGVSAQLGNARTPRAFQRATDLGSTTASSWGTVVDAGASANTYGSAAQIIASTAFPIKALQVNIARGTATNNNSSARGLIDIGVGAGGSEQWGLIEQVPWVNNSTTDHYPAFAGIWAVDIPVGTRIATRMRCTATGAAVRLRSVQLIAYG